MNTKFQCLHTVKPNKDITRVSNYPIEASMLFLIRLQDCIDRAGRFAWRTDLGENLLVKSIAALSLSPQIDKDILLWSATLLSPYRWPH